jgi:4a-hydroxytetrahydrobiopterin dehydratase
VTELADRECVPCKGGVPPLEGSEITRLARELDSHWNVVDGHHLEKRYEFPDFKQGLDFVYRIGLIADAQGHHPDVRLSWGAVVLEIYTHAIDGLTESDFVLAAKFDRAL